MARRPNMGYVVVSRLKKSESLRGLGMAPLRNSYYGLTFEAGKALVPISWSEDDDGDYDVIFSLLK
jgi:hypothetical protein